MVAVGSVPAVVPSVGPAVGGAVGGTVVESGQIFLCKVISKYMFCFSKSYTLHVIEKSSDSHLEA